MPGLGGNRRVGRKRLRPAGPGLGTRVRLPGGDLDATDGAVPQRSTQGSESAAGVSSAVQPGLGRQLSRRVKSGEIDQSTAQRTAVERVLLERAYGPDWRTKVYGDRGYAQRTRLAAANNPDDPQVQALYANLMKRRKEMLDKARAELGGG